MSKKKDRRSRVAERPPIIAPRTQTTGRKPGATVAGVQVVAPLHGGKPGFPIIGIGASAGGLEALEELVGNLPKDTGMGFVIITHQHPGHVSLLPSLLSKCTEIPVVEATDGVTVQPDHIYISPSTGNLAILHGVLHLLEAPGHEMPRLPIDHFFRSLAVDQKEHAICIILSGTGTDGTLGMKAVKGESGMAMVQQVQSAKYAGMPSSAMATGLADYVLPPGEMPERLVAYAKGPYLAPAREPDAPIVPAEPMQKIFLLLRGRTGHDFSAYKANTVRRRIERRMNLHQIKAPAQYLRYLQENPAEIDALFKELLISVTSFRDAGAFEALGQGPMMDLIRKRPPTHTFRAWVPGCSSGEEVYSLCILFRECLEKLGRPCAVQLFGSDLDSGAIDTARAGAYPAGIAADVAPQRLSRYFNRDEGTYRVRKEVREMVIFAVQNVIKDPPFTRLDLISCRNLMIYLNADLQKRLLPVFHYALKPDGLLMLGPSETIGTFGDLFEVVDKKWKVFRRKQTPTVPHPILEVTRDLPKAPAVPDAAQVREVNIAAMVDRLLLARFAPSSVVVNGRGDIAYIHGRTGAYLEPAAGRPRLNILDMAREGLQVELGTALRQAAAGSAEVDREGVRVRSNGGYAQVGFNITHLHEPGGVQGLLLITFCPGPPPPPGPSPATPKGPKRQGKAPAEKAIVTELRRELRFTKESLQSTVEDLETFNEELKSANEELQSTNEELQSANEEMETSKEELQSLNEELTTVNAELESKVDDLSRATDDMQNLLNGIDVAMVFLDNDLKIKRYTEQARKLINLIPSDVGRPLGDLVAHLAYPALVEDCREVLRTLAFRRTDVQDKNGAWYLMRIIPYRTGENVIDGVVVTFVDVSDLKKAQQDLRRMSKVFTDHLDPIIVADLTGKILDLNAEAARAYGWTREELLGQDLATLSAADQRGAVEELLHQCVEGHGVRNVRCVRRHRSGREMPAMETHSLLLSERGEPEAIAVTTRHIEK